MFRPARHRLILLALAIGALCLLGARAEADPPSDGIPAHAVEVAPGLYYLGKAQDRLGREVEGYLILHPKRNAHHRPDHAGGPGGGGPGGGGDDGSKCFQVLARGAKWKTVENFSIDPANSSTDDTITDQDVLDLTDDTVARWEARAADQIFGVRIGSAGDVDGADDVQPDLKNELLFADIGSSGTLAYTITWGIFSGPPQGRELVEWDMVFDDDGDWVWSDLLDANGSNAANAIDFETVLLHELGHALGLGHSPETCQDEVMYAFYGGVNRVLGTGDTAGVQELYGTAP